MRTKEIETKHGERRYDSYRDKWQEWDEVTDGWWDLPEPISKSIPKPKRKFDPIVISLVDKYLSRSEVGIKKYGTTYTDEQILTAAKEYVASFNGDYRFMKLLKYFIFKEKVGANREIEPESELMTYIENAGQEDLNNGWLTEIR